MTQIYILRGPVRSGKTTNLKAWCERRQSADGILAPVVDGLRHLYHISTKEYRPLETTSLDEAVVSIGTYRFLSQTFLWARERLEEALQAGPGWIIVDEIGPLELAGQGLEPAAGRLVKGIAETPARLILVVREHLVHNVTAFYAIDPFKLKVITLSDLKYIF